MENKYYTPDIEDLFQGYECEINQSEDDGEWKDDEWGNHKIDLLDILMETDSIHIENRTAFSVFLKKIRTPCLTKEQIEKEGFPIFTEHLDDDFEQYHFKQKDIDIYFTPKRWNKDIPQTVKIIYSWFLFPVIKKATIFDGEIKSINEFRKIIKQVASGL